MVQLKIRKAGNSLVLKLPTTAASVLKASLGGRFEISELPDGSMQIAPHDADLADALKAAQCFMGRYRNALRELAS